MKLFRQIALSAMITLSAFAAVVYTSCSKDACKGVTCNNGGTCSGGNCTCLTHFTGVHCDSLVCNNGGTYNGSSCTCATGYEGTYCDTLSRAKFLKSWSASDMTGSTSVVYTANIAAGTGVTQVLIGNFSNFFTNNTTATISGNTITISLQAPDGNNYQVQGSGTLSAGVITWSYTITDGISPQTYTGTWH